MPIPDKKSTNIRQNLDIKLKNGPFSVQNCPFPIKITAKSGQNINQY